MPVVLKLEQGKGKDRVRIRLQYQSMEALSQVVRTVLPVLLSQGKFLARQQTLPLGFEIMEQSDNQNKMTVNKCCDCGVLIRDGAIRCLECIEYRSNNYEQEP